MENVTLLFHIVILYILSSTNVDSIKVVNRRILSSIAYKAAVPKRISQIGFINTSIPWNLEYRINRIGSGWGFSDKYSWKENNEYVYVTVALDSCIKSSDLNIDIKKDSISVVKQGAKVPIMSGKTKGKINISDSLWTIEDLNNQKNLQITLKKAGSNIKNWFGVILGENVRCKQYGQTVQEEFDAKCFEPNGIFWSKSLNVKAAQLNELFSQWVSRDGDLMIPFGKPMTEVEFKYILSDSGGRLTFSDTNLDEYMEIIIKSTGENSSEILFVNSASTDLLTGKFGIDLRKKLLRSLNTFIEKFETDIQEVLALMATTKKEDEYSYAGSSAFLSTDNIDSYNKYHESIRRQMRNSSNDTSSNSTAPFNDDELGISINWDALPDKNVTKEENIEHKKRMINELTEAIRSVQKPKPVETMQSIIKNFKERLALNSEEYEGLWQNSIERIEKEVEQSKEQQNIISKAKTDDDWFTNQINANIPINLSSGDSFDEIMNNPINIDTCLLVKKYHSIKKTQREQLRKRWKSNEVRLKTLIIELFQAPESLISTICNNYTELLISEDYPTLMKSYLLNNEVKDDIEKERLKFLNEFVLSLYKDSELYVLQDEQFQLAKIRQICEWAINDYDKLNDYVEANKQQYDLNFMTYLKLAISKESEKLRESGLLNEIPNPQTNTWLCILIIIERAITSLIEADMAEDIYIIGLIVTQKNADLRSYATELILATMPRSDWKAFKNLVISITDSLLSKPMEEREAENMPLHVPEACHQLRDELEKMIPDWVISELLSESDRTFMKHNNVSTVPCI
ncbi:conserved hypothetical protein [Theileria equi strain WA]|uniref:NudC domain-containing protein 1 n=1 Tax=Theileria equi strain WA TaxID=1537102 RepID=L1LCE7_THEEQ|nr:conserved hypothetical protein [Theileria equi strain WA]EKX72925.1 conserved hypothetical protein [Theileria equi strain WA]|eukprot:XP_004832377.1 conserved hypothetical protein [Theileria equi strain WA]